MNKFHNENRNLTMGGSLSCVAKLETDKYLILNCKHCGESTQYTPMYGKFGYSINCNQCGRNTSMKLPCPQCESKSTKVTKRKETCTLNCMGCEFESRFIKEYKLTLTPI